MPRIPEIYLETTIFNFPFADDAPQYKADTLKLFAEIKAGKHRTIIQTEIINAREGYKQVFIHTPAEVIDYAENL